ncbi:hypothetical protein HG535_0B05550 [Zygotorulaspora mrakii]|uniref:Uncharacterized protein n=1 Tax=Zygotorulaspora mrakii TaxID=42260 RepID=A0A7H9B153_ZYGMR|nr:uncharacterized protein HG535_0B05550 [Zygotorulaspora mrakii]QLG71512.1 hypothetical protein HG535_0B05550 [Zygotorulaspora mrakii]
MSPFNDYCVVCDQLIPQSPESVKNTCTEKKHSHVGCSGKVLYCSEDCRQKDQHLIHQRLESLVSCETCHETVDDPESLIKSPLLVPIDHSQQKYDEGDDDGGASYRLMNMVSSSTISIPRLSLQPPTPPISYDSIYHDHVAEKNYQLWLNQNH